MRWCSTGARSTRAPRTAPAQCRACLRRAVEIPGFGSGDYTDFFTPGVVVMTAFFSAGWSGMSVIQDIDRGVIDRFLGTPVKRSALIVGRVGQAAITIAIQSLIIVALALIVGANFANGVLGVRSALCSGSPWAPCPTDWRWSCARRRR